MEIILRKAQSMLTLMRETESHLRREVPFSVEGEDLRERDRVNTADLFMAPAEQLLDRDPTCDQIQVALDP
jgi:hypothetical protein